MSTTIPCKAALCLSGAMLLFGAMLSQPTSAAGAEPVTSAASVVAPDARAAIAPRTVDLNPEAATHVPAATGKLVHGREFMVSTANPHATRAATQVMEAGGSVVDAAIAAQLVLGLVEPQSSGIGGGGFALLHRAGASRVTAYDGRETAPAAAQPDRFMRDGRAMDFFAAVDSGLSVGTPGLLRMLEAMHEDHGALPWAAVFEPAIRLAEEGFAVSPRLHALVKASKGLRASPTASSYFYDKQGNAWPVGHVLRNPDYAEVLREVAGRGAEAFYHGPIARDMVAAVSAHAVPGDLTEEDLAAYKALRRDALCADMAAIRYCGMPPPSSGGVAVMQIMGILAHTPIADLRPNSAEAVHYFSEAGRLAFADRDAYIADPAFARVPVYGLLDPDYLASRAQLIRPERSMGRAEPGAPPGLEELPVDSALEQPATTHLVVADHQGNVVSMTTSVESAFGSKIFVNGYLLNNQMTDFSLKPLDDNGRPLINRIEPGKRPRSSMAPMLVFKDGRPLMALGSPGGSAIINYVAKTMVGSLLWDMDLQSAIELPHMGSRNRQTEIEKGTPLERAAATLKAMGHEVRIAEFPSGLHGVMWTAEGLAGAADPRREGVAAGR